MGLALAIVLMFLTTFVTLSLCRDFYSGRPKSYTDADEIYGPFLIVSVLSVELNREKYPDTMVFLKFDDGEYRLISFPFWVSFHLVPGNWIFEMDKEGDLSFRRAGSLSKNFTRFDVPGEVGFESLS